MMLAEPRVSLLQPDVRQVGSSNSIVQNWIRTVYRNGGTVSAARAKLFTDFINGLATDGIVGIDALWVLAGENVVQKNISIIGVQGLAGDTTTFTPNVGCTGDAAATFIDTGINPGGGGYTGAYSQNLATLAAWVQNAGNIGGAFIGNNSVVSNVNRGAATTTGWAINGGGTTTVMNPTSGVGFQMGQRTAAGAEAIWHNGISKGTQAAASVAVPNFNVLGMAANNAGAAALFSNATLGVLMIGGGLVGFELLLYNRLHTLMTGINPTAYP